MTQLWQDAQARAELLTGDKPTTAGAADLTAALGRAAADLRAAELPMDSLTDEPGWLLATSRSGAPLVLTVTGRALASLGARDWQETHDPDDLAALLRQAADLYVIGPLA